MKVLGQDFLTSIAMTGLVASSPASELAVRYEVTREGGDNEVDQLHSDQPATFDFELDGFFLKHERFVVPGVSVVPGVNVELKLRRLPTMVIRDYASCCIDDWGVSVTPASEATSERMAKEVVRKFLGLFRKAQQRTLVGDESKIWRQMLKDFDVDEYMEASAPPVHSMGLVKDLKPKYAVIQWSDDPNEDERVDGDILSRLSFLREGDVFTATARFVAGRLVALDNVFPCDV